MFLADTIYLFPYTSSTVTQEIISRYALVAVLSRSPIIVQNAEASRRCLVKMRRASSRIFASVFSRSASNREYRVLPSHEHHEHQSVSTKSTALRRFSLLVCQGAVWRVLGLVVLTISLFFSALVIMRLPFLILQLQSNRSIVCFCTVTIWHLFIK